MAKRIFIYLILALMLPNIALCFTEGMTLTENLTNLVLPAGLLMLLASVSGNAGKTVWLMFPLIFFAAFQLVLLYLFGEGIISVDMFLNVVTTNTGEIEELLGNLVPAVAGVFVVYIPLLVVASVAMRRGALLPPAFRHKAVRLGCAATAAGTVLLAVCYATAGGYRILTRLYPANVCYNLALAIGRSAVTANYASASAAFTFHARSTHPADSTEVYVLVIGETARARNFSLYGYSRCSPARPTSPSSLMSPRSRTPPTRVCPCCSPPPRLTISAVCITRKASSPHSARRASTLRSSLTSCPTIRSSTFSGCRQTTAYS